MIKKNNDQTELSAEEIKNAVEFIKKEQERKNMEQDDEDDDEEDGSQIVCGHPSDDPSITDVIFYVNKKFGEFISYTCPVCNTENKVSYSKFSEEQHIMNSCINCNNSYLLKLDFKPELQLFTPVK